MKDPDLGMLRNLSHRDFTTIIARIYEFNQMHNVDGFEDNGDGVLLTHTKKAIRESEFGTVNINIPMIGFEIPAKYFLYIYAPIMLLLNYLALTTWRQLEKKFCAPYRLSFTWLLSIEGQHRALNVSILLLVFGLIVAALTMIVIRSIQHRNWFVFGLNSAAFVLVALKWIYFVREA